MQDKLKLELFLILLFIAVTCFIFLKTLSTPRFVSPGEIYIAKSFTQSLDSSYAIYVAQQRAKPKSFKDFVATEGSITGAKTVTLENIKPHLKTVPKISDPLVLTFSQGGTATYYLCKPIEVITHLPDGTKEIESFNDRIKVTFEGF